MASHALIEKLRKIHTKHTRFPHTGIQFKDITQFSRLRKFEKL